MQSTTMRLATAAARGLWPQPSAASPVRLVRDGFTRVNNGLGLYRSFKLRRVNVIVLINVN